jgi:hypothetical protein
MNKVKTIYGIEYKVGKEKKWCLWLAFSEYKDEVMEDAEKHFGKRIKYRLITFERIKS